MEARARFELTYAGQPSTDVVAAFRPGGPVEWSEIRHRPTVFPPSAHSHPPTGMDGAFAVCSGGVWETRPSSPRVLWIPLDDADPAVPVVPADDFGARPGTDLQWDRTLGQFVPIAAIPEPETVGRDFDLSWSVAAATASTGSKSLALSWSVAPLPPVTAEKDLALSWSVAAATASTGSKDLALSWTVNATTPPPDPLMTTHPSGIGGLGFQNETDVHDGYGWVAVGADVAGIALCFTPTALDPEWSPARDGTSSSDLQRISGLRWEGGTSKRLWAFSTAHDAPSGNNWLSRMDVGGTLGAPTAGQWIKVHQLPSFASAGNGIEDGDTKSSAPDGSGHPRNSGGNLELDTVRGYAYTAHSRKSTPTPASRGGIYESRLDGTGAPAQIWGAGKSCTSVRLDPNDATILYVTVDLGGSEGLYKLQRTGAVWAQAGYIALDYPQGIAVVDDGGTHVFVATGKEASRSNPGMSVVHLPPGAFTPARIKEIDGPRTGGSAAAGNLNYDETGSFARWAGIAVRSIPTGFHLLATHSHDSKGGTGTKVGWCTYDGTNPPTWTKANAANVSYKLNHAGGPPWIGSLMARVSSLLLDKGGFDCVSPVILSDGTMITMGRSGGWRKRPADAEWFNFTKDLAVTYCWGVQYSPDVAGRVVHADTDWSVFGDDNYMEGQPSHGWAAPYGGAGRAAFWAPGILAMGFAENGNGGAATSANAHLGKDATWVKETDTGSGRGWTGEVEVRGVWVRGTGAGMILLVVIPGDGMWRKVGSGTAGTWTEVGTGTFHGKMLGTNGRVFFAGTGTTVYCSHSQVGLCKSVDSGFNWTVEKAQTWGATNDLTGAIDSDPVRAGCYLWIAGDDKIWRVTPSAITQVAGGLITNPTSLCFDPTTGTAWCFESGARASRWKSVNGGVDWVDTTDQSFRNLGLMVRHSDCSIDGRVSAALQGGYLWFKTR